MEKIVRIDMEAVLARMASRWATDSTVMKYIPFPYTFRGVPGDSDASRLTAVDDIEQLFLGLEDV